MFVGRLGGLARSVSVVGVFACFTLACGSIASTIGPTPRGHSSMNTKSLDINDEAQECLQNTESQQGDLVTASPEPPTQPCEDGARHHGQPNKARDVVPVRHVASANCLRREKMAQQARTKKYESQPDPKAATGIGACTCA